MAEFYISQQNAPLMNSLISVNNEDSSETPPPVTGVFLLLDGTNFLLLDGTNFLLL